MPLDWLVRGFDAIPAIIIERVCDFCLIENKFACGWNVLKQQCLGRDSSLKMGVWIAVFSIVIGTLLLCWSWSRRINHSWKSKDQRKLLQGAQRDKLIEFFNATNGPQWKNNSGWCTSLPVAKWKGVFSI